MKRLATAIALAALTSTAAMADHHMKKDPAATTKPSETGIFYTRAKNEFYASNLIGARIYVSEKDVDGDNVTKETRQEWDDIGEIDNLIVTREGQVKAVIIGVGGFLGVGEKDVAVNMSALRFVREKDADDADDYFIVVKSTKKELESAPAHKD